MELLKNSKSLFYDQIPLIEIDGLNLAQSGAAMRYIGRKYNMYGINDQERYMIDLIYEGTRDARGPFGPFQVHKDTNKLKEEFKMGRYFDKWESYLQNKKEEEKTGFFTRNHSIADIAVYEVIDAFELAFGVHETKSILESKYPNLCRLKRIIDSNEHIRRYKNTRNHVVGSELKKVVDAVLH